MSPKEIVPHVELECVNGRTFEGRIRKIERDCDRLLTEGNDHGYVVEFARRAFKSAVSGMVLTVWGDGEDAKKYDLMGPIDRMGFGESNKRLLKETMKGGVK